MNAWAAAVISATTIFTRPAVSSSSSGEEGGSARTCRTLVQTGFLGQPRLRPAAERPLFPAPSLDELRALEAGEIPMPLEAHWISILSEQAHWLSDAAEELIYEGEEQTRSRLNLFWYPGRLPGAKRIAHLRGALRGRTLPENFRPPDPGACPPGRGGRTGARPRKGFLPFSRIAGGSAERRGRSRIDQ